MSSQCGCLHCLPPSLENVFADLLQLWRVSDTHINGPCVPTESLVLFPVRHYAEDVIKGVSLPHVLSAKRGRKRQFVVPRYVRIKLAIRLAVTTAALSKGRSPCRAMVAFMIRQSGRVLAPFS